MILNFYSSNFSPTSSPNIINGWEQLQIQEVDLLHAAYTVGRANRFSILRHGIYSIYEMIYRTAMIRANLLENRSGYLTKSPAYKSLDPSEKGAVSYFIGMTVVKLLAEFKLDVPYIMHLEVYENIIRRRVGNITYRNGLSRPDFIAMNNSLEWFVFESKGRSNNITSGLIEDAKEQSKMIRTIGGIRPIIKSACVSYFHRNILTAEWMDPTEEHEFINIDLPEINPIKFIRDYYKPFFDLVDRNSLSRNPDFTIFNFANIGVSIRFPEILFRKIQEKELTEEKLSDILKETESIQFNKTSLSKKGKDGIIIELDESWAGMLRNNIQDENSQSN